MKKQKYPSTKHVPWSPEKHRDDDYHEDVSFFEGREVILTEKMDGENTTIYSNGEYHARSLQTPYHPSRTWAGKTAGRVGHQLPDGWRICGENVYAKHSIKYENLDSYFYVFSIWNEENKCLSWDKTVEWCGLLDLNHVPVIWRGMYDESKIRKFNEKRLNETSEDPVEGYVMRTVSGFDFEDFSLHLAKWVRPDHVQTDEDWLRKEVEPNELNK
jgi:ATP-dependent RNA circularization protein (DNA/RNA ligase family)